MLACFFGLRIGFEKTFDTLTLVYTHYSPRIHQDFGNAHSVRGGKWTLLLGADEGAHGLAVGAEGEDGEGVFVVLRVVAMAIGGFEEVDLRGSEVEGLRNAGNL